MHYFLILISFLIVALSQPDFSAFCGIATSVFAFALFWKGMLHWKTKKGRFFLSLLWFGGIQAIQMNWLLADRYVGPAIYVVYSFFVLAIGCQFGLFSLLIYTPSKMRLLRIIGLAGCWTFTEWGRLFFFSGYTWNPVGLALTGTHIGLQMASLVGIYGLSFWIMLTNLMALKIMSRPLLYRPIFIWGAVAATPFLYGAFHSSFHQSKMRQSSSDPVHAISVQAALSPEQKVSINGISSETLSPYEVWGWILSLVHKHHGKPVDLIAISEGAVPYGTHLPIYFAEDVQAWFALIFGEIPSSFFPPTSEETVGNSYWVQTLANLFDADVAIGLDDIDMMETETHAYNASFLFRPFSELPERYAKRILLPMAEYIPFDWCRKILKPYGIQDAYTPGKEAKVFSGKRTSIGMSICYEETFGHLMTENRRKGAGLLVNLTNDVWYPRSRLPMVHFLHGRVRAVECGIPVLRSCNTGVTCAIDSLGRTVATLDSDRPRSPAPPDALYVSLSTYSYFTLYSRLGDFPIIALSIACMLGVSLSTFLTVSDLKLSSLIKNEK